MVRLSCVPGSMSAAGGCFVIGMYFQKQLSPRKVALFQQNGLALHLDSEICCRVEYLSIRVMLVQHAP